MKFVVVTSLLDRWKTLILDAALENAGETRVTVLFGCHLYAYLKMRLDVICLHCCTFGSDVQLGQALEAENPVQRIVARLS